MKATPANPDAMASSSGAPCSAWMTWHIRYTENHEPLRYLSQTVKARNQNEAERKAEKLLSGRYGLWQVVLPPEHCGDCDPCLGGRPDQCAICPTPNAKVSGGGPKPL